MNVSVVDRKLTDRSFSLHYFVNLGSEVSIDVRFLLGILHQGYAGPMNLWLSFSLDHDQCCSQSSPTVNTSAFKLCWNDNTDVQRVSAMQA